MDTTTNQQFWTPRRVLGYTLIVALVLFVVYKQSLVQYLLERTAHVTSTGPIPAEDIGQYAETYARGMEEISRLISPVT